MRANYESIMLVGYDSRDGNKIGGVQGIDNYGNGMLCARSCRVDSIPALNGTEFIAIYVKNVSAKSIRINDIIVNGALHTWSSTVPPRGRMFSLLVGDNIVQGNRNANEIPPFTTAKILLKLSNNIDDIQIGDMIEVGIPLDGYIYRERIVAGDMA
ncbi:MAG: hypothetical protein ACK4FV_06765 [Candidatus Nitrosocaldus sp.]